MIDDQVERPPAVLVPASAASPRARRPCKPWLPEAIADQARKAAAAVSEAVLDTVSFALNGSQAFDVPIPVTFQICMCTASFCRSDQLLKSLPINLATLQAYVGLVTWVLVVFEDDKGHHASVCNWVREFGREAIASGLLVFKTGLGMKYWHASIGKNTAHRVAMEIDWAKKRPGCAAPKHLALVNLDNDNLPGPTFVEMVASQGSTTVAGREQGGTCGRICYWAKTFDDINGYDEDLEGVGYQDIDIVNRIGVVMRGR